MQLHFMSRIEKIKIERVKLSSKPNKNYDSKVRKQI